MVELLSTSTGGAARHLGERRGGDRFERDRVAATANTVWVTGCRSWYLDDRGVPAAWPWPFGHFRDAMSAPVLDDFDVRDKVVSAAPAVVSQRSPGVEVRTTLTCHERRHPGRHLHRRGFLALLGAAGAVAALDPRWFRASGRMRLRRRSTPRSLSAWEPAIPDLTGA